ncbi:MAG: type II toxin-antitoxin system HipA family toxin [Planctomycetota bacterium]
MTTAEVVLWGTRVGAVTWRRAPDDPRGLGWFEYDPAFVPSGVEVAPLEMPLPPRGARPVFSFPELRGATFRGLPGLLADSLPDRFGNALIDSWLASRGRTRDDFDPVQQLCYVGVRGMGALEYRPAYEFDGAGPATLDVAELVGLASLALTDRSAFATRISDEGASHAVRDILRVGTSAGGARAKAVVAWNRATGEIRSGQVDAGAGFEHWMLKFDGVSGNVDHDVSLPLGYGRVEYAYHLMAVDAGIAMSECRLLEEGGRSHFATRRFDRTSTGDKLHMQTLGAIAHLDYELAGAHSYEQALEVCRRLALPAAQREQLVRRAFFNVVARNQDDHVKNVAFLMDRRGTWSLAPAYDVTFAFNPSGTWTARHQMSLAGRTEGFERRDLESFGASADLGRGRAAAILDEVLAAVRRWPEFAERGGVTAERADAIAAAHRLAP